MPRSPDPRNPDPRSPDPRSPDPRSPDELRALVEEALEGLELWPELHGQAESVRYSIAAGGKRVRPVICLATAEAAGGAAEDALAAGCALELVHTFSLVHDDLPALDDDEERRGQPSTWKRHGEAVGILAGDALLAEAFRLAASYEAPRVARELAEATLGMIGGQYLDVTGTAPDAATLHTLKTGCLFAAAVGLGLCVAGVPESGQQPWRAFGGELGLLFQIVDDILDGDGYVLAHGPEGARRLADEAAERARARLEEVDADTSVLREIVDGLAVRTA
jgi:geranylgeranyl diphosphate synthase, type II